MYTFAKKKLALVILALSFFCFASSANSGVLNYGQGLKFSTVIFQPKLIALLPVSGKEPYLVYAGFGCRECDINRSIYIHSPSDVPMQNAELGDRYLYPGIYYDADMQRVVKKVRMFAGSCLSQKSAAIIWFIKTKEIQGGWVDSKFVARVEGRKLIANYEEDPSISLNKVLYAVSKRVCKEVPGAKFASEP